MLLNARMYTRQPKPPEEQDVTHVPKELTEKGRESPYPDETLR